MTKPQTIQVQAYNLAEYSEIVQKHFKDGYEFDFASNQHYPTSFGTFYTCTMVLPKEADKEPLKEAVEQPTAPSSDEVEGQVPATPKKRSKAV